MDLEQRVNLLEQEVKLLKTEIQTTLLDIQEQLLSTRFSNLRGLADSQPELPGRASAVSVAETPTALPGQPAVLKVFAMEAEASPEPGASAAKLDVADEAPLAPEDRLPAALHQAPNKSGRSAEAVTMPAAAVAPNGSQKAAALPKPKAGPKSATDAPMDWETMRRQTDWTIQTVRKFGPERTRQLIEVYTQSGFLSASTGLVLQRVTAAFQPDAAPARNLKSPAKKVSEPGEEIEALDTAQKRDIIRRIITRLQKSNARRDTSHG